MMIALPDGIVKKLKTIKRRTNLTDLVDVMRRALALYDLLTLHKASGGRIILELNENAEELVLEELS